MAPAYCPQPGYYFGDEFEWGLELILDALPGEPSDAHDASHSPRGSQSTRSRCRAS